MPSQSSTTLNKARAPLFRAADLGLTRGAISTRVKRGTLHRVHRGVYSLVPREALTRESQWLAALMAVGDDSALARLTAGVHWRAWRWPAPAIEVVVPRYRRSLKGVHVHECRNLDPRDVTTHLGIPRHDGRRTAVDLTDELMAEELTNFLHEAAFRRRLLLPDVRAAMARSNGRRNLARLEEAIDLWRRGSAGIKSRLEREFLRLVVDAGLPKPIPNIHVDGIQVDAYWPGRAAGRRDRRAQPHAAADAARRRLAGPVARSSPSCASPSSTSSGGRTTSSRRGDAARASDLTCGACPASSP